MNENEIKDSSYQGQVKSLLMLLGFAPEKRSDERALDTFSRWVASVRTIEQSEEMKATWTQFVVAQFSSPHRELVDESAEAATRACILQMRTFPPRAWIRLGDAPDPTEFVDFSELQEWRDVASKYGWSSPESMRNNMPRFISFESHDSALKLAKNLTDELWIRCTGFVSAKKAEAELSTLREWETIAKQRGWNSPMDMRGHSANYINSEQKQWQDETGCTTAAGAGELIRVLRKMRHEASDEREQAWIDATGQKCPSDAEQWIDQLKSNCAAVKKEVEELSTKTHERNQVLLTANDIEDERSKWRDGTGQESPDAASKYIASLVDDIDKLTQRVQSLLDEREQLETIVRDHLKELHTWVEETKCMTATGAGEYIRELRKMRHESHQAWIDATGQKRPSDAERWINELKNNCSIAEEKRSIAEGNYEKTWIELHERNQDLLTANAEIDRIKKAARTLGMVSDDAKELAKVRAELQTKCREAQILKESGAEKENEVLSLAMILTDIRKTLESKFPHLGSFANITWAEFGKKAVAAIESAIVPLPKPEKTEVGQTYLIPVTCDRPFLDGVGGHFDRLTGDRVILWPREIKSSGVYYLGK